MNNRPLGPVSPLDQEGTSRAHRTNELVDATQAEPVLRELEAACPSPLAARRPEPHETMDACRGGLFALHLLEQMQVGPADG